MEQLSIIKIGGNVIDDPVALREFLKAFSKLDGNKVLVHGGGKIATKVAEGMQLKTQMVAGRRVTDNDMIDVVTMTYGGLVNKKIVSQLQGFEVNAVGLTGADGNLILSKKRPMQDEVDFGWVGDPMQVNTTWLKRLTQENQVPVIAPLTHDGFGNLLNTNADTIARVIGVALSHWYEVSINYCFELNGVLEDVSDPASLMKSLSTNKYLALKESGRIGQGMLPKLDNAFNAVQNGVKAVRIMHHQSISKVQNGQYDEFTTIH